MDRMFHLDPYAMKQRSQNQPQMMEFHILRWLHCRESHTLCEHRYRKLAEPLQREHIDAGE